MQETSLMGHISDVIECFVELEVKIQENKTGDLL